MTAKSRSTAGVIAAIVARTCAVALILWVPSRILRTFPTAS